MYDIETFTTETLTHLGDRLGRYFGRDEIKRYAVEGYYDLCFKAKPLWDVAITDGPLLAATVNLPAKLTQVERAAWDGRRLEPMHSKTFEGGLDYNYQNETGDVSGYMLNKDGVGKIRLYKAPTASAYYLTYAGSAPRGVVKGFQQTTSSTVLPSPRLGMFARMTGPGVIYPPDLGISISPTFSFLQVVVVVAGGIASIAAFLGFTLSGTGVLRMMSGMHPSEGVRGGIKALRFDSRNLRVEYQRRPYDPRTYRTFELPDYAVRYVRHYVMAKAYRRDGPLQDLRMSKSYDLRYANGVERLRKRMAAVDAATHYIMGSGASRGTAPPLAQLPWQYPARASRRRR